MKLAVIPARGGSKRIPRKNIKYFSGKPIIAWSIEAAINSGCFDRVVVSTDDEEIANVARIYGAEVPFTRPTDISDDFTTTIPVIAHAISWEQKQGVQVNEVCCIYATAPFLDGSDLRRGLAILTANECDFVLPVASFPYPVQRALRITEKNKIEMIYPEFSNKRSQDLVEAYHDAGQFYWGRSKTWLEADSILSRNSIPMILTRNKVQDIDTMEDWERAELIFNVPLA